MLEEGEENRGNGVGWGISELRHWNFVFKWSILSGLLFNVCASIRVTLVYVITLITLVHRLQLHWFGG